MADIWEQVAARGQQVYSVHNAFGPEWDLGTPEEAERKLAGRNQAALLRAAGQLGAEHSVLHAGEIRPEAPAEKQLEYFLRSVESLLPVAEEAGVLIALENLPADHLCSTPTQMRWLLERLDPDRVGFCCDTGHAQLTGTPPAAWVREFHDRLLGIHLQDTHGDNDAHLFPGRGLIDWEDFFAALRERDYRLPITLEALPPADLPWEKAVEIARRSVERLEAPGVS